MSELTFTIGHEELVIRQRWEVVSIVNDILVAVWFIVGSVLFFGETTAVAGTWFFLIGSVELLIRPMIRLARRIHIQRVRHGTAASDSSDDY